MESTIARAGIETNNFGRWLRQEIDNRKMPDAILRYDHGDPRLCDDVSVAHAYCGVTADNATRLGEVDLLLAQSHPRSVLLAIEIEEREISPKAILGDIWAVLMSDGIAAKRRKEYYAFTTNTRLVVAGVVPDNGKRRRKIDVISRRLHEMQGRATGIDPKHVELIFHNSLGATIESLRERCRNLLDAICSS